MNRDAAPFLAAPLAAAALLAGCPSSNALDDAGARLDTGVAIDTGAAIDTGVAIDTGAAIDTGGPALDAAARGCARNSECAIRAASCCGRCGAATAGDFLATHVDDLAAVSTAICEAEGNPPCPECAAMDDPFLAAVCRASACVGLDLRLEPITECSAPGDCTLAPRQCCDCGLVTAATAIAYNPARGAVSDYVCDDDTACPPCVPTYESGLTASCVAGRCVVFGPD